MQKTRTYEIYHGKTLSGTGSTETPAFTLPGLAAS